MQKKKAISLARELFEDVVDLDYAEENGDVDVDDGYFFLDDDDETIFAQVVESEVIK